MLDNQLMHAYDADGRRRGFADSEAVAALADDPFRSLAGELRRAGGFAKDTTPFSEFLWADFLRRRISAAHRKHFYKAISRRVARQERGRGYLPGWCGPHPRSGALRRSQRASSVWKLPPACAKIAGTDDDAREDGMSLTQTAFGQLMRLYGRETPDFVRFDEGPSVLATRFAADEAVSAAALAAGGTVAADLWQLRTGEAQRVEVGTRERPPRRSPAIRSCGSRIPLTLCRRATRPCCAAR